MTSKEIYYAYVLYSEKHDRIYIGQTSNLSARVYKHNAGLVGSTKPYKPWKLVWQEEFSSRAEAMKREKELKSHKGREVIRAGIRGRILSA